MELIFSNKVCVHTYTQTTNWLLIAYLFVRYYKQRWKTFNMCRKEVSYMTQMGVNYLNYLETNRSNLANEGLKGQQNAETMRHNFTEEGIGKGELKVHQGTLDESIRSHKANESIDTSKVSEMVRSNLAREAENFRSNQAREEENRRSDIARENENLRHNTISEGNERYKVNISNAPQYVRELNAGEALGERTPTIVGSHALGSLEDLLGSFRFSSNAKDLF